MAQPSCCSFPSPPGPNPVLPFPPSWQLLPFIRPANAQPIITRNPAAVFTDPITHAPVHWEALHTFNPAAVVRDGKVMLLFRAEDDSGSHGHRPPHLPPWPRPKLRRPPLHPHAHPRLLPCPGRPAIAREWPGGVEDPRLIESPDGTYVLTYTQWNRITYSVGIATSRDLIHWTKHGPAFGSTGKYGTLQYKSAGILTQLVAGHLLAAKLHGKYWMYWGEGHISLATSPDLIHWTPVESPSGAPVDLLDPRPRLFDSGLPEVGPPPMLTSAGILLLYNGKNANVSTPALPTTPSPDLDPGTYSAGQALFSADDPTHLLARTDQPFLRPQLPWERSGQYAAGTTFIEGLVPFHNHWFLYYGSADSLVGVALGPEVTPAP